MIRHWFFLTGVALWLTWGCASRDDMAAGAGGEEAQIIPLPNRIEMHKGAFLLRPSSIIVPAHDEDGQRVAEWLSVRLTDGTQFPVRVGREPATASGNVISLEIGQLPEGAGHEGYRLTVTPDGVTVTANDTAGLFYGAVSLWQLVTAADRIGQTIAIPAMRIDDAPRFAWRGLMLDAARHFVPPQSVKDMIDWMALHKLNVLHWHLTDDQGWRIEIDAYPRLTDVGAWRTPAGRAAMKNVDPVTGVPRQYGGYYTKEDVRDIVAYAAERHVTIVPEIEMPGHAQAAIAAYPELGAGNEAPGVSPDWGIHNWLFNVEESTFDFLETVLGEVLELFPGQYIHVGGDEAVKERWVGSERVQQRMRELGVADETELQSYFVRRMERFLNAHGRRLIGWDEILEGGIAPRATVMSWRGIDGALTAAALGHDTVLSPWPTLYFDHRQSALAQEPPGRGLVVSLEDVYRFDPMPAALRDAGARHVLGLQGNVWSEHIRTPERVAYMTFPRAAALAEVAWSQPHRREWIGFLRRLAVQFERYRRLGLPFATSAFDVRVQAQAGDGTDRIRVELSNQAEFGEIRYTADGRDVTAESARYAEPLELSADTGLAAATFVDGRRVSRTSKGRPGQMARHRYSHELELCSEKLVLSLEDDAPVDEDRSVFLIDIMNPCWMWREANLTGVSGIRAWVGQVPFNFQIGSERDRIFLPEPATPEGELEVRAGGCDGEPIVVLPLAVAADSDGTSMLSRRFATRHAGNSDLCFRFTAHDLDPLWGIDRVELVPAAER